MRRTSSSSSSDSDRPSPVVCRSNSTAKRSSLKRRGSRDIVRVVVAGDTCVGKSAITVKFLTKRFIGTYQNEKDMLYKTSFIEDSEDNEKKKMARVEILDTSSNVFSDDYECTSPAIEKLYWSSAVILVYDITNSQSYQYATDLLKDIKHEKPNHPCVLLGNKTDLEHNRSVSQSCASDFVSHYSNCLHVELSAASSDFSSLSNTFENLFSLSLLVKRKPIKRRKSFVDVAKAISNMLKSSTSRQQIDSKCSG